MTQRQLGSAGQGKQHRVADFSGGLIVILINKVLAQVAPAHCRVEAKTVF